MVVNTFAITTVVCIFAELTLATCFTFFLEIAVIGTNAKVDAALKWMLTVEESLALLSKL